MCSGSEAGSYLRLIDCVYQSTLGLIVIKKKIGGRSCPSSTLQPLMSAIPDAKLPLSETTRERERGRKGREGWGETGTPPARPSSCPASAQPAPDVSFLTLVTGPRRPLILKLSDTRVCEPHLYEPDVNSNQLIGYPPDRKTSTNATNNSPPGT